MEFEENYKFKNTTVITEKVLRQSLRKMKFKFGKRELLVILGTLIVLLGVVFVPRIINKEELFSKETLVNLAIVGSVYVFYAIIYLVMPFILSKRIMSKRKSKGNFVFEVCFYEERFSTGNSENETITDFDYSKVVYFTETNELLLLIVDNSGMLILEKSGFEDAVETEFKDFIKEKCQNAKIKIKG